jgi:sugar lactone lactonase YvrE
MRTAWSSRARLGAWLLPAVLGVLGSAADAQVVTRGPKSPPAVHGWPNQPAQRRAAAQAARWDAVASLVAETEPNDGPDHAVTVPLGDAVTGLIDPVHDVDFFSVTMPEEGVLEIEVLASRSGSPLDSWIRLYGPDGRTLLEENDDYFGLDSRIRRGVPAGRYFVSIHDFSLGGGSGYTYSVSFRAVAAPPGDPTTLVASDLGQVWGVATAPGRLVVVDLAGDVLQIEQGGEVSVLASGLYTPHDVVVDAFGDVLVAASTATGYGVVHRIRASDGELSQFTAGIRSAGAVTVGPDGDVWVIDGIARRLLRFDTRGRMKSDLAMDAVPLAGVADLAFSPAGELHLSNYMDGVYRLRSGTFQRVVTYGGYDGIGGIAFDVDGYLYVGSGQSGVTLYGPDYQPVRAPFATEGLILVANLAFGRDESGAMTSRIFAGNLATGEVREMNPAGVRAAGHRIGVDFLRISAAQGRRGLMGADYADTLRVVDGAGPHAWTLEEGELPPGLSLESSSGVITGVPAESGAFEVRVGVEGGGRIGSGSLTIAIDRPEVTISDAADHLLGRAGALSTAIERFLDLQGNRNGRYDVGDLRVYMRAQGYLP